MPRQNSEIRTIDLTAPAIATWHVQGEGEKYLSEPGCLVVASLIFDENENTAFFKLRVPVRLQASPKKMNMYLFIHPEQVFELRLLQDETQRQVLDAFAAAKLSPPGQPLSGLDFSLNGPGAIISPVGMKLLPASETDSRIMDLLLSLGCACRLSIFVPSDCISTGKLDAMCKAASNGGLKTTPKEGRLNTLYAGRGGRVVIPGVEESIESPPSYDELALTPPPKKPLRKRSPPSRRGSPPSKRPADETVIDQAWRSRVEGQLAALASQLAEMAPNRSRPASKEVAGSAVEPAEAESADFADSDSGLDTVTSVPPKPVQQSMPEFEAWRVSVDKQLATLASQVAALQDRDHPSRATRRSLASSANIQADNGLLARLERIEEGLANVQQCKSLDDLAEELREEWGHDIDDRVEEVHHAVTEEIESMIDDHVTGIREHCERYIVEEVADVIARASLRLE